MDNRFGSAPYKEDDGTRTRDRRDHKKPPGTREHPEIQEMRALFETSETAIDPESTARARSEFGDELQLAHLSRREFRRLVRWLRGPRLTLELQADARRLALEAGAWLIAIVVLTLVLP